MPEKAAVGLGEGGIGGFAEAIAFAETFDAEDGLDLGGRLGFIDKGSKGRWELP